MVQDAKDSPAPGRIIIGPPVGQGALDRMLAGGGAAVLVEPDPDRAAALESRGAGMVIAAALDDTAGTADLVAYNFPGLRSIKAPAAALHAALPGLREISRKQVATITPQDLVDRLGENGDPVHLHLDAPGSEMTILSGLATAGLVPRIAGLHLRCGAEPMFEGATGRDEILDWVLDQGFKLTGEEAEDPDWPELSFAVDQLARDLDEARATIAVQERQAETDRARIADLEQAADADAGRLRDLKTALAEARAQGAKDLDAAQAEIETERKNTQSVREALHKRNGELDARTKAAAEARETHARALAAAEERATAQQTALTEAEAQIETAQAEIARLTAQLDAAQTTLEAERKTTRQARDALNRRNAAFETQTRTLEAAQVEAETLKARLDTLEETLRGEGKARKAAEKTLAKRDARLKARNEELQSARAEIETQADALEAARGDLAKEQRNTRQARETLNRRNTEYEARGTELKTARAEIETLSAAAQEAEQTARDLDQAKADLAVALRMQMLAQSDLRDMQTRYREVEQARAAQQALLEKLTPRLQQAARQLQQMHLAETETAARLEQNDPAPKPKPKAKRAPRKPRAART